MNITKYSIVRFRIILVFLAIIVIGGINSYNNIPRSEDPGFIIRTAVITTQFPGASPKRVEMLVTDKIEEAIQEIPEVDYTTSSSQTGLSTIYVNIKEEYKNLQPIWDRLIRKVNRVKPKLPQEVVGPVVNDEFGDVFGSIITLTAEGYSYKEMEDIAKDVRDELLRIKDVAKVEVLGEQKERIFVEYDNARLAELDISPYQLGEILEAQNIIFSGGSIKIKDERITLEPTGSYETLKDIENTILKLPDRDDLLFLGDIVSIQRGYIDPPEEIVNYNGQRALALAVSQKEDGNIIELGEDIKKTLNRIKPSYPIGVEFNIVAFQPEYVNGLIKNFTNNLVQSVSIVILLMLIFLGIKEGILVASLIPITILMTFLVMNVLHINIDKISLSALIISLGMLVDNAIVMSESIISKMQEGRKMIDAILGSVRELRKPLLIATLITASAFLPIALAESTVGEYCSSLFSVVSISLLNSWILALTMIPLFIFYLIKVEKKKDPEELYEGKFYKTYRTILLTLLKNPFKTMFLASIVFAVAIVGFIHIPKKFFPDSDRNTFLIEAKLPIGTDIEKTEKVILKIGEYINKNLIAKKDKQGITSWVSFTGNSAPRFILSYAPEAPNPSDGTIIANTTSNKIIPDFIDQLRKHIEENFPDVTPTVRKLPLGPPANKPVEIEISGKNVNELFKITERIKEELKKINGVTLVTDNWGIKSKKIIVVIDPLRSQRSGVTNLDIAISLQAAFSGFEISEFREGSAIIPLILRTTKSFREDLSKIESINVYSQQTGQSVPLTQVATLIPEWQNSDIKRKDRLETITVQAEVDKRKTTAIAVTEKISKWIQKNEAPYWSVGYFWEAGGIAEKAKKSNISIFEKLPITGLLIFLLLVIQFNSLRNTAMVLGVLPLAMIGVTAGLLITRSYFGFITLLGVLSLFGILINNSVVLLDRVRIEKNCYRDEPQRAIVMAAQKRLRPIILSSTTTIGGLIPLWLASGPMFKPMAIAIIFGLIFGMALTLLMIPVFYSILYLINFKNFEYQDEP